MTTKKPKNIPNSDISPELQLFIDTLRAEHAPTPEGEQLFVDSALRDYVPTVQIAAQYHIALGRVQEMILAGYRISLDGMTRVAPTGMCAVVLFKPEDMQATERQSLADDARKIYKSRCLASFEAAVDAVLADHQRQLAEQQEAERVAHAEKMKFSLRELLLGGI
ncbi:Uncharacterised protein [Serratia quinivorans]|nr:Uncharacterised protein [Serratia quinivorans]